MEVISLDKLVISGPTKLKGEVTISGAKNAAVAILENQNTIIELNNDDEKTHSQKLMPMIDEAFKKSNMSLDDINLISCCLGPGSFTGVRIGIATAKAFSDSKNIPTFGVSSLEALAHNLNQDGLICGLINANNGNVYAGIFEIVQNQTIKSKLSFLSLKDSNGNISVDVPNGNYTYTTDASGYKQQPGSTTVSSADKTVQVQMQNYKYWGVTFNVKYKTTNLNGASVSISNVKTIGGTSTANGTTNSSGQWILAASAKNDATLNGAVSWTASLSGYRSASGSFNIVNANQTINVTLESIVQLR